MRPVRPTTRDAARSPLALRPDHERRQPIREQSFAPDYAGAGADSIRKLRNPFGTEARGDAPAQRQERPTAGVRPAARGVWGMTPPQAPTLRSVLGNPISWPDDPEAGFETAKPRSTGLRA